MKQIIRPVVLVVVGLLLIGTVLVIARRESPERALYRASVAGDLEKVKSLIKQGANVNFQEPKGIRWTPLLAAVNQAANDQGETNVVFCLVERGADVNLADRTGKTPLMWSAIWNNLTLVTYLIEHGANTQQKDSEGYTALDYARSASAGPELIRALEAAELAHSTNSASSK